MFGKLLTFITSVFLAIVPVTTYTEGVAGQPNSFLSHQTQTQTDRTISNLIYRGLFKYDIYGTLTPDLVEDWEVSEDGLVYTITLKDNQYWSDGTKITSDDLIYTAFKVDSLSDVATDKVDNRTVRFTLPNKFSPFLSLLTVGVMQSNTEEEQNHLKPVSSGQFKVVNVKRSGPLVKEITLYNQKEGANIKKLSFRYYANEKEVADAAKLGEIDGFLAEKTYNVNGFENHKFPIQSVYYALIFNLRSNKLSDLEFREDLRASVPINEITSNVGIPAQGAISKSEYTKESFDTSFYNKDFSEKVYDKEITITVPEIKKHKEVAKQIEHSWEDKLNLAVDINEVNPDEMMKEVIEPRDFEVLFYGKEVGRDPDRYVHWHSTQTEHPGLNIAGFSHVRADRALEEGRNVRSYDERVVHYNEFQDVIEEQVPAIFMYHPFKNYYVSEYVNGIGKKYTFTVGDRFLDFDNWKISQII